MMNTYAQKGAEKTTTPFFDRTFVCKQVRPTENSKIIAPTKNRLSVGAVHAFQDFDGSCGERDDDG